MRSSSSNPSAHGSVRRRTQALRPSPCGPSDARSGALLKVLLGAGMVVVVLVVGVVARLATVADLQLGIDRYIAVDERTAWLTTAARVVIVLATPEIVGVGAIILMPLVLLVRRRRVDALRVLCVLGGASAFALVVKQLINERRPPAWLWAVPADSGASYPSGHTTVAAAIAVAAVMVAGDRARAAAIAIGGLYTLAVALSRVYVGNHFPLDVVGSIFAALAAGLVVAGLSALPAVRRRLGRLDAVEAHAARSARSHAARR